MTQADCHTFSRIVYSPVVKLNYKNALNTTACWYVSPRVSVASTQHSEKIAASIFRAGFGV